MALKNIQPRRLKMTHFVERYLGHAGNRYLDWSLDPLVMGLITVTDTLTGLHGC